MCDFETKTFDFLNFFFKEKKGLKKIILKTTEETIKKKDDQMEVLCAIKNIGSKMYL